MTQSSPLTGSDIRPLYRRAKAASAHFQIAPSTLWHWVKNRPGFPQPLKAGEKVTLFDIAAIEAYLKALQ